VKGLWKMTWLMEIRTERGFPQPLGKAFGFPTFPTGPTAAVDPQTELFSTAAFHLRKANFLSEGWGVPQFSCVIRGMMHGNCEFLASSEE
jgi:hypothetical protein